MCVDPFDISLYVTISESLFPFSNSGYEDMTDMRESVTKAVLI